MKNITFVFLFLLFPTFYANAQLTDVLTDQNNPVAIALTGNDLYISNYTGGNITKIDITEPVANPTIVLDELNGPHGLAFLEDELYFSLNGTGGNGISKIDLTVPTPSPINLITDINTPIRIKFKGNELYYPQNFGSNIMKINVNAASIEPTEIINNISSPYGLAFHGNDLYISQFSDDKISKIDVTQANPVAVDVVTNLSGPAGILISGNLLLITEYNADKISYIDVTETNPSPIDLVNGVDGPTGIVLSDNVLYIAEYDGNKISKTTLSIISSTEEPEEKTITLFPNPANQYIQLSDFNPNENYKIFNTKGIEVKSAQVLNDRINIQHLSDGMYLFVQENGKTLKFIKQ